MRNKKRIVYTDSIKQLIVDLYLNYKMDCDTISKHFRIDKKDIKRWANSSKYDRKLNKIWYIIGKLFLKFYFKK